MTNIFKVKFIRQSDEAEFVFTDNKADGYALSSDLKIIDNADIDTSSYNYAGLDGAYAVNQTRRTRPFDLTGFIFSTLSKTTWEQRTELLNFFRIREYYTIIFYPCNGDAFRMINAIMSDGPFVEEKFTNGVATVDISFLGLDPYLYRHEDGIEYVSEIVLRKTSGSVGGRVWTDATAEWVNGTKTWIESGIDVVTLNIESVADIYPRVTIHGPCVNPQIANLTTGVTMGYNGVISENQTLVFDSINQTVKMSGANVINNFVGSWMFLQPGENRMQFTSQGGETKEALMEWNEVVG